MANIFQKLFINKQETPKAPAPEKKVGSGSVKAFNYLGDSMIGGYCNQSNLYKGPQGYLFGEMGLYPQTLNRLFYESPLHSSIIKFKQLLTTGNGYTSDSTLEGAAKVSLFQLTNQFESMLNEISLDYHLHSRVCIKVTWNQDNTKILKLERLSPETIHINDVNEYMQPITFLFNWNWEYFSKYPTVKLPKFDQSNKKDKVQLYFYQVEGPGQLLYSQPSYASALKWIGIDSETATFHESNIQNSLNPSMLVQYFVDPETDEEKQKIGNAVNASLAGARAAGRAFITFSPGKDLAQNVVQLDQNKLDKTFLSLSETIQKSLCYAHSINPLLLGISQESALGNGDQILYAYNLFNKSVIDPAQRAIEGILNEFLNINGLSVTVKLNSVELVAKTPEMKAAEEAKNGVQKESLESETPVNDHLKNMTGKQSQMLDRILRKYDNDKLSRERAIVLLKSSLGLSDEQITQILDNVE